MSEKVPQPKKPNYSRRRKVVGGTVAGALFLTGAATGKFIDDKVDDYKANSAQPACDIAVEHGDSVYGILEELEQEGDRGDHVLVLTPEGRERNTIYGGENGVPTLDSMQPGDHLVAEHVDPNVCRSVGGTVLGKMPTGSLPGNPNVPADQDPGSGNS